MKTLLLVMLVACGSNSKPTPGPGNTKPINAVDRNTCKVAEDCALVEACCGCAAGGKRVAIRKDAVAEYDASRQQRCGDMVCTTVMSEDSSCNAEATCEAGHCKVMAHMGKTQP
jgi:hypothetical protein